MHDQDSDPRAPKDVSAADPFLAPERAEWRLDGSENRQGDKWVWPEVALVNVDRQAFVAVAGACRPLARTDQMVARATVLASKRPRVRVRREWLDEGVHAA